MSTRVQKTAKSADIAPEAAALVAECTRVAETPLDDEATRAEIVAYFAAAGVKDYDASWAVHLQKFLHIIQGGETDLARVTGRYFQWLYAKHGRDAARYIAFDQSHDLPSPACLALLKTALRTDVFEEIGSGRTGAVMELGSGWSDHLFGLWLAGASHKIRYLSCEITESGRRCAETLARLAPRMKFRTFPFNYEAPDFTRQRDWLRADRKLVVFSSHSVEQVDTVSPDLLPQICALGDEVVGIHYEPVGWQMEGPDSPHRRAHAERCREMKYNTNFWIMLQEHARSGLIRVESAEPYFIGMEYNPAARIVWRKLPA